MASVSRSCARLRFLFPGKSANKNQRRLVVSAFSPTALILPFAHGDVVQERPFNSSLRKSTRPLYPPALPLEDSLWGRATIITAFSRVHVEYKASSNLRVSQERWHDFVLQAGLRYENRELSRNGRNTMAQYHFSYRILSLFLIRLFYFWGIFIWHLT